MAAAHKAHPADSLRTYTVAELERLAAKQLKSLEGDFCIPVDIEALVERTDGVDLDVYPKLRANHGLLGMVGSDESGTIVVYVDDDLADSAYLLRRYRMTVAEEFAHILLHREAILQVRSISDFRALHDHHKWHEHERNAKRLAAALLMPARHVLDDSRLLYSRMVAHVGYSNSEAVKKMVKNKLADKYIVSVASMGYRLDEWPVKVMDKIDTAMRDQLDFLE